MNCNCNNKDGALGKPIITLVQGNLLRLAIPLTLRTLTLDGGTVEHTDDPFYPSSEYPVEVELSKGATRVRIAAEMDGNVASIEDDGTIPIGVFSITVTCRDDKGRPYRFKQNTVLNVVDTTREAGIEPTIEYEVQTWYLDAAIFLATGGGGVQSDWAEEDTESGAYIKNKPTIPVVPTNVSAFRNDAGYLTQHQDISGKVDMVQGKGLSSNDYTDAEKTKLAGIAEGATANVGTVTGIKYNDGNAISPVNGVVDLGTVITQHQSLDGKQDVISDLSTIRSGASKGATSVQSISVNGGEPSTPDTNGNVDLQVSGGQGSNGFTINETATALVLTVWDGAELVETATSITIQQS